MSSNMKKSGNSRPGQGGLTPHQLSELLEKEDLESFKKFLDTNGLASQSAAQLLRQLCDKNCKCMQEFQKISLLLEYLDMRNPFFYDKTPEDCPVVKAFEANKHESFRILMKKPAKQNNQQYERIALTLLFQAVNKYDKQKGICQQLFKTLGDSSTKRFVNQQKEGHLLLNEAILKRDPSLVNEILNLNPNATFKDITAIDLAHESGCHPEISKMIMDYQNGDKRRVIGGMYDPKDPYGQSNSGQPYPGTYNKRGDFKNGEEPSSPSRQNAQSSNGSGFNEANSNRRRKDNLNPVIVGSQQGQTPLSLTASGAHQAQKEKGKGNKQSSKGDPSSTNPSQSARGQPQLSTNQSGSSHQQDYHKKGSGTQSKEDSKKIVGYVPENFKLTHMKEGSKRGNTKKGSRNQGYGNQHYDDRNDPEYEGSSYGRDVYPGDHYESKGKGGQGQTPSQIDSEYGYYADRGSQRGAKSKYEQGSVHSRGNYDPKDKEGRYGHAENDERQYGKMSRHDYYPGKSGADIGEDSQKGVMAQNYVYNQQDFGKSGHISASGSKKGAKMTDETSSQYRNKPQYGPGSNKKDIEVDNIMVGQPHQGYYPAQYAHPGQVMNPAHAKYKTQQNYKKQMEMGQVPSKDILDAVSGMSEQEKLAHLMIINKSGEGGIPMEAFDPKGRGQNKYIYPPYDYNPQRNYKGEYDPTNPERPSLKENNSKSSKESLHNKVSELEKLVKEREQVAVSHRDPQVVDDEGA